MNSRIFVVFVAVFAFVHSKAILDDDDDDSNLGKNIISQLELLYDIYMQTSVSTLTLRRVLTSRFIWQI